MGVDKTGATDKIAGDFPYLAIRENLPQSSISSSSLPSHILFFKGYILKELC
jgi:hypothetical protein